MKTIGEEYPRGDLPALVAHVDYENYAEEHKQQPIITEQKLYYRKKEFRIINYNPSEGARSYMDEDGEMVKYPSLLLVHGVTSDTRYFEPLCVQMVELGIPSCSIEFPRMTGAGFQGEKLFKWQVGAVKHTYEELNLRGGPKSQVVIGGHSRGAIIATKAARRLVEESEEKVPGLLLLAPAGFDLIMNGKMALAATLVGPLAINSVKKGIQDPDRLRQNLSMVLGVALKDVPQSYTEIKQAINISIVNDLECLKDTSIFVPAAKYDEFVDHNEIKKVAERLDNMSVITMDESTHMLEDPKYPDLISLADPRVLPGQLLNWLQSMVPSYSPKSFNSADGIIRRLHKLANFDN